MRFLCHFMPCKWNYLGNVMRRGGEAGLYRCMRCGDVSIGAPSDPADRKCYRSVLTGGTVRYSSEPPKAGASS